MDIDKKLYPHEKRPAEDRPRPEFNEPFPEENVHLMDLFFSYLNSRQLSPLLADENGWYATDRIDGAPRVVIPMSNERGVSFWQARALTVIGTRWRSSMGVRVGSICVVWPVFSPPKLFGRGVVLVEGPMDALAAAGQGYLGLAAIGLKFTAYLASYITRIGLDDIIVVPDMDGPEFGTTLVATLSQVGLKARMKLPIGAKDLAGMSFRKRRELLK